MTTTISNSNTQGEQAEKLACSYLVQQGLRLVSRNYRCRLGEIDLIMQDKNYLVFIEVRYRKHNAFGSPSETVTYAKQQKIIKAARLYLQANKRYSSHACRFDVIAITKHNNDFKLEWIKDAFQVSYHLGCF